MLKRSLVSVFVLTAVGAAAQASAADSNLYGVLSLGRSELDTDAAAIDAYNARSGFTGSSTASGSGATGVKAQLGYNLGKTFALEGGYTYLGKADFTSTYTAPAPGGAITGSKEAGLFNLDLVAKLPMGQNFSLLGRFGGYYWKTRSEMPNAVTLGTSIVNDTGFDFKIGAGVQYEFTPQFALRGEFERYNGIGNTQVSGDSKVNQWTVGAVLKF